MRMEHNPALGASIRDARLAAGLSQQQVADALEVNLKTAGQWERTGAVPPLRLAKLRQVLPTLGEPADGDWQVVPEHANGRRHMARYETHLPLKEPSVLARIRRLRRELSRISIELDECLEELERGQSE